MSEQGKVILEIRAPKTSEETPESMSQVFSALSSGGHIPYWKRLWITVHSLSFEIVNVNQTIRFCAVVPAVFQTFLESQLTSQYPKLLITKIPDYMPVLYKNAALAVGNMRQASAFYYPIRTFAEFKDLDPLSSVIGVMSKFSTEEQGLIQIVIEPSHFNWQKTVRSAIANGIKESSLSASGTAATHTKPLPGASLIEEKMNFNGFRTYIRILIGAPTSQTANALLMNLAGSFGAFALGEGNRLVLKRPRYIFRDITLSRIQKRKKDHFPRHQILNAPELATLWHPSTIHLAGIRNIAWGRTLEGEPPSNLPVATDLSDDQKREINFFAKAQFKNQHTTFGIKRADRRKHMYIIGKTGTGKSTLIANMAINDMRNGEGMAVIDPHGDLSEIILNYVPSYRINDVVYLEPYDTQHPFHMNVLEVKNPIHKELVSSGIVAIFSKLYSYSWGPRLEYILRNCILTLIDYPDATLPMVLDLLADANFRTKVLSKLNDSVLQNFWRNEFEKMQPRLRTEAIAPIQNKVGQFVSSHTIRGIIGHPKSTIDLEEIMDQGKIMILNLSQGKLGEDNAALLGAMFITQMQLASMNRVHVAEVARRDFYLYVDEFQNFATTSFIKILSEARKYRLNLTLANQYVAQVDEDVQKAIFGNAGTLVSFILGAQDARAFSREFGQLYKEEELVSLGAYQVIIKLAIDNITSYPFPAHTLPLPRSINQNKEKVIRLSKERYTKTVVGR